MTDAAPVLRRSPLDDRHRALGAHMTPFAGWEMPLDYGSVVVEHRTVRGACAVFDLSHLGTLRVTGSGAPACVQRSFSNDAAALAAGRAHYSLCLAPDAGIIDDLLVYRLDTAFFVVPNAANTAAVRERLEQVADELGNAHVADVKADLACLAVQGPRSSQVAQDAGLSVADLGYLDCRAMDSLEGAVGVLARSGYTGERGFEVFVAAEQAGGLWDRLCEAGAEPAGLGARDTLRLEMGYPLHGQDISGATTPVEAGLRWAVKTDTAFIGREAYLRAAAAGPKRRLRGLRALERGVPRAHCRVLTDGQTLGETTSGTFSPTLRLGIALGYLDSRVELGTQVVVDVRRRALAAEVVAPPFVDADPKR